MEDYIVSWVISGVLFWTTTFLLVRSVFRNRSFDFCNRVVSTVHAAVAVGLASLSVQHWGCPVCPLASRSSAVQVLPTEWYVPRSALYPFPFDESICFPSLSARLLLQCGSEMVATMWITEISSPFLHMRELMKELGYRDTNLSLAFDVREISNPYLSLLAIMKLAYFSVHLASQAMALGLQLVSAFWFYKILRMV
ncbi:hypothetical protein BHM03_00029138, partial [Ensete ventricosum]